MISLSVTHFAYVSSRSFPRSTTLPRWHHISLWVSGGSGASHTAHQESLAGAQALDRFFNFVDSADHCSFLLDLLASGFTPIFNVNIFFFFLEIAECK